MRAFFVCAGQPAIASDIGLENGGEFAFHDSGALRYVLNSLVFDATGTQVGKLAVSAFLVSERCELCR